MIYFQCDYEEGCHPAILKRLNETNLEQTVGYSMDPYCASAREKIKRRLEDRMPMCIFLLAERRLI